jgi:hypothetical protein
MDPTTEGAGTVGQTVQVRITGAKRSYDYTSDLEPPLVPGDWVTLPGNVVSADYSTGVVTGTAAPTWKGELKAVTGWTSKPDPWLARMRSAKDVQTGRRIWHAARREGVGPERMKALEDLAQARWPEPETAAEQRRLSREERQHLRAATDPASISYNNWQDDRS